METDAVKARLIELEQHLFKPETRASRQELEQLIADDFIEINAAGLRYGKHNVLNRLPDEVAPEIQAGEYQLKWLGPDHAQLLYRAIVCRQSAEPAYSQRCSVWQRQLQGWQMIYHQGTPCSPFEFCAGNRESNETTTSGCGLRSNYPFMATRQL